jgi:2-keto-4-pentenoate hydratase/2-oxohepta-3-ene-1,7-dioic acid hydratase in catechol pathway
MKLASYVAEGKASFGAVVGDGVIDIPPLTGGKIPGLRQALAANALDHIGRLAAGRALDRPLAGLQFLPVVPDPQRIVCVGINYRSHAEETGRDVSPAPSVFLRLADTLIGHGQALVRPRVSDKFDFEGELAVVIGRAGRHVSEADALAHVAGYTCFVDGSVRDYQKFSVTSGKNFPATGPLGPVMVTADEIGDPTRLTRVTRLNGREMQRSGTDLLIFDSADHQIRVGLHQPRARRCHRHGNAGGRRPSPHPAGLDEARRRPGSRDFRHRHLAQSGGRRSDEPGRGANAASPTAP